MPGFIERLRGQREAEEQWLKEEQRRESRRREERDMADSEAERRTIEFRERQQALSKEYMDQTDFPRLTGELSEIESLKLEDYWVLDTTEKSYDPKPKFKFKEYSWIIKLSWSPDASSPLVGLVAILKKVRYLDCAIGIEATVGGQIITHGRKTQTFGVSELQGNVGLQEDILERLYKSPRVHIEGGWTSYPDSWHNPES